VDILQATQSYETWLGRHVRPVANDLRIKHERMASSPFVLLRGTFYRWIQQWPTLCAGWADAPRVLAVGDVHVENFGTWRDLEGRLVWGVNDVDEACVVPYTQDLIRLATSAMLAVREGTFGLSATEASAAILEGYRTGLATKGQPFVLAESPRWLRQIAVDQLRDPTTFWTRLTALRPARGTLPHRTLRAALPDPHVSYRVVRRVAGVGSLGRPRFVALASWGGSLVAREAKAWVPSALVWSKGRATAPSRSQTLLGRAVRVQDPYFTIEDGWVVRRLAPDCTRIEMAQLPTVRDAWKLLRAMGHEIANLHLGTRAAPIAAHLARLPDTWLNDSAKIMTQAVTRDWRDWSRRH
jgi:hypothetical protein